MEPVLISSEIFSEIGKLTREDFPVLFFVNSNKLNSLNFSLALLKLLLIPHKKFPEIDTVFIEDKESSISTVYLSRPFSFAPVVASDMYS